MVFHHCDKYLREANSKEESFSFAHGFKGYSHDQLAPLFQGLWRSMVVCIMAEGWGGSVAYLMMARK
jgi:hypothetical protein